MQANTAIGFYMRLRKLIASKLPSYRLDGEVEADESYLGGVRKGKRGRGAGRKVALRHLCMTILVHSKDSQARCPICNRLGAVL